MPDADGHWWNVYVLDPEEGAPRCVRTLFPREVTSDPRWIVRACLPEPRIVSRRLTAWPASRRDDRAA